jgi:hypothetical protein
VWYSTMLLTLRLVDSIAGHIRFLSLADCVGYNTPLWNWSLVDCLIY